MSTVARPYSRNPICTSTSVAQPASDLPAQRHALTPRRRLGSALPISHGGGAGRPALGSSTSRRIPRLVGHQWPHTDQATAICSRLPIAVGCSGIDRAVTRTTRRHRLRLRDFCRLGGSFPSPPGFWLRSVGEWIDALACGRYSASAGLRTSNARAGRAPPPAAGDSLNSDGRDAVRLASKCRKSPS